MTRRGRLAAAACVGVALAALAGCTSGGGTTSSSSPPAVTSSAPEPTSSAPSTPDGSPTSTPPTTTGPAPTSSPPAPPSSSTPPTPSLPTCAALDVSVTRVPGAAGVTYGLVSVTSRGTARCRLPGIPSLRLLDASRSPVTAAASAISVAGAPTALDPGGVASTLLQDRSDTCQANTRSAFVEVRATPAAATVVAALALPPCSLSVKPFTPGTQPSP